MTSPSLACHQARGLGATRGAARSHDLALGALAAGATLPLGILGPGRVLDDWYTLFWAWSLGRTHAAGPTQGRSRPLGALVYDVQFGLIGDHPRVWWALQALIAIATTLLLRRLIAHFAPPAVATAVAGVWILSANHSTLDSWASGSPSSWRASVPRQTARAGRRALRPHLRRW